MDNKEATLLIGLVAIGVVLAIGLVLTIGGVGKGPAGMGVSVPSTVYVGDSFDVLVKDSAGNPLQDALVTYGAQTKTTDASGKASLIATEENIVTIEKPGYAKQTAQIGPQKHKITLIAPSEVVTGSAFSIKAVDENGNPVSNVEVEKSSTGEKKLTDSNGDAWFIAELDEKSAADTFKGTKQYYNQDVVLVRTKYHSFCSDACSMKAEALAMSHGHKQGGPKPKPPEQKQPGQKERLPRLKPKEPSVKADTLQIVDAETKEVLQEKQFIDSATGSAKALQGVESTDKGYVVGTEDSKLLFLDDNLDVMKEVQLDAPVKEVASYNNPTTLETEIAVTFGNKVDVYGSDGKLMAEYYVETEPLYAVALSGDYVAAMDASNTVYLWDRTDTEKQKADTPEKEQRKKVEKRLPRKHKEHPAPLPTPEKPKQRVELDKACAECNEKLVVATEDKVFAYEISKDLSGDVKIGEDKTDTIKETPMCAQHCAAMYGLTLPADEWGGK